MPAAAPGLCLSGRPPLGCCLARRWSCRHWGAPGGRPAAAGRRRSCQLCILGSRLGLGRLCCWLSGIALSLRCCWRDPGRAPPAAGCRRLGSALLLLLLAGGGGPAAGAGPAGCRRLLRLWLGCGSRPAPGRARARGSLGGCWFGLLRLLCLCQGDSLLLRSASIAVHLLRCLLSLPLRIRRWLCWLRRHGLGWRRLRASCRHGSERRHRWHAAAAGAAPASTATHDTGGCHQPGGALGGGAWGCVGSAASRGGGGAAPVLLPCPLGRQDGARDGACSGESAGAELAQPDMHK